MVLYGKLYRQKNHFIQTILHSNYIGKQETNFHSRKFAEKKLFGR